MKKGKTDNIKLKNSPRKMEESVFSSSTATNSDENEDENWSDINTDEADDDNGLSYFDK